LIENDADFLKPSSKQWRVAGGKVFIDGLPQGKTAYFNQPFLTGGPTGEEDYHRSVSNRLRCIWKVMRSSAASETGDRIKASDISRFVPLKITSLRSFESGAVVFGVQG